MADQKKKSDKKMNGFEIFDLSLFGTIWVAGLTIGALGIYAMNTPTISNNPIYQAEVSMSKWLNWPFRVIDWRIFGVIIIAIGVLGLLLTFYYFANKYDRKVLKEKRRAERLKAIMAEEKAISADEGDKVK